MGRFRRRLRFLLSHSERQRLLWEEMEFHIESMAQDFAAQGMSEVEARAAARRKFGNMTQKSEESRGVWLLRWWSDLAQDLRYAFRGMRRDAAFTAFVILIAGLGIGASSTVFSVVNALLLRPLPFRDPGRLVWIANQEWSTQVSNFLDLREQNRSFSDLAGWSGGYGTGDWQLTGTGEPERVTGVPVTQNLFSLLGVEPVLGRSFTADECRQRANVPQAVLLSYGFWQRRFASDPSVVGSKLMFNNRAVTVAGVLPASFDFAALFAPGTPVDIFIPWPLTEETNRRGNTMTIIGRLKPGASVENARPEFTLAGKTDGDPASRTEPGGSEADSARSAHQWPRSAGVAGAGVRGRRGDVDRMREPLESPVGPPGSAAKGAGHAGGAWRGPPPPASTDVDRKHRALLLRGRARAEPRHRRHRCGGASERLQSSLAESVRIDGNVLAFTLLAAVFTGVLFGVLPALQAPALAVQDALKEGGRGLSAGKSRAWLRNGLVVSEIAFASILLVGAGLLVRSFVRVLDVDLGFEPEHTAVLRVDSTRISNLAQQNAFLDDMLKGRDRSRASGRRE